MVEMPAVGKREAKIGPWLSEAWSLTIEQKFIGLQLLIGLVVGLILAALSMTVLGPLFITMPIICGLFYFASKRIQKKPVEFGDVFRGFDVFVEGLIASLIIFVVILVMIVVIIVVNLIGMCCATVLPVIPVLLSLGAMGLLYAGTVLVPGLLFDRRMKAWDAIKVNLAYAKENLPMLFFYGLIVSAIITIGSMITMGIGMIILIPFSAFAGTVVYRDWVGFAEETMEIIPDTPVSPE